MNFTLYKRLLSYTRPYRKLLILGIFCGFLSGGSLFGVLSVMPRLVTFFQTGKLEIPTFEGPFKPLSDWLSSLDFSGTLGKAGANGDSSNWTAIVITLGLFLGMYFLRAAFTFVNRYALQWVGGRVVMDIRNELFARLTQQGMSFFTRNNSGSLISHVINDTNAVQSTVSNTIADLSRAPIDILAVIAFVGYRSYTSGIMVVPLLGLVMLPLAIAPIVYFGRRIRIHTRRALEQISHLTSRMNETFGGIQVVKAFHTEAWESKQFNIINERYFRKVISAMRADLIMRPSTELAGVTMVCGVIICCQLLHIPLGLIATLTIPAVFAYEPIKSIAKVNMQVQQGLASAERIFELLDTNTALPEKPNAVALTTFKDAIRFEGVNFGYDAERPLTVRDISFEIPRGKMVAFVGETGSGKSTISNLLSRFFDPNSGRITVDGVDLRDFQIASLRANIGIVTQRTFLFNDTIAANIAYGLEDIPRERVEEVARQAKAHDFIMAREHGYDALLSEKAGNLSGGEQQRLAIARALLRDPQILILDEATSALDTVTEQLVREALNELVKDRTVFAIAHRLSTIRNAHRIYVMQDGLIIEQGTHEELLALNGKYKRLNDSAFE